MSPRLIRRPGTRYRVVVTEISPHGDHDITYDHTGDAYIAGVAIQRGTRITADTDHDGDTFLQQRLVTYITDAVHNPPRPPSGTR
jgi:hypothetical protein